MKTGVITLHFGEPARAEPAEVVPYLERIFTANASLEEHASAGEVARRSRELAERRAPALLEEYRQIGGSPLNAQAESQARALAEELERRDRSVSVHVGMQFTEPHIATAVERAREAGAERLVALPVYPLCGQSTTVASLEEMSRAVRELGWEVPLREIAGWHRHPGYLRLRAENIRDFVEARELDLDDPETVLVFSAHGTPLRYLREEGNRYDRYVEDCCRSVAALLEAEDYLLGYQNHQNRDVPWTEPDIESVIRTVAGRDAVVVPISFMHEQSETLSELDIELREEAAGVDVELHRVPVPHDAPAFSAVLADLVESSLEDGATSRLGFRQCRCRSVPHARCLNAALP